MAIDYSFSSNYLLGRGKVLVSEDRRQWYDLGNTPQFSYTITVNSLEHKNSRERVKKTDKECLIEIMVEGTIQLDTVHVENIRLFILGDEILEETQAASPSQSNDLFKADLGYWKNVADDELATFTEVDTIDTVVVQNSAEDTTYVKDKDYILDVRKGKIMILPSGDIAQDDVLHIDYNVGTRTRTRIGAANVSLVERHLRFVGNPACGSIIDIEGFVSLLPEGEFSLIGDDFAVYSLAYEFLSHPDYIGLFEHIDYGEAA